MTELGLVKRKIHRADRSIVDRLARYGASTEHEAIGRPGLMKPYMRPICSGAQVSGTAVTVPLHPGENWMMHVAAEQNRNGVSSLEQVHFGEGHGQGNDRIREHPDCLRWRNGGTWRNHRGR
jgi:hypothetical protein